MRSQPSFVADATNDELDLGDYTEGEFWLLINERQATDLASGCVPNSVRAMATSMLTQQEQDAAAAARPAYKSRKGKKP